LALGAAHDLAALKFFEFATASIFPAVDYNRRGEVQSRIIVSTADCFEMHAVAACDFAVGDQVVGAVHQCCSGSGIVRS
jgi:hypothetical protein